MHKLYTTENVDSVKRNIKLGALSFPLSVNMKLNLLNSGSVLPDLPENTGKGDKWPEDRSAQILDAHDKYLKIKLKYWVLSTNA